MILDLIKYFLPGFTGLLLLLTLPALATASPPSSCSEPGAEAIKVELDFATSPVKTGSNEVVVKLYNADGQPVGGAEVTAVAAQPSHDETGDDHSHQAQDEAQPQADPSCDTEAEASHQPAQANEHDLADMAGQAGPEMDNHQPAQAAEHDMADMTAETVAEADDHQPAAEAGHSEGHSGGHGQAGPAELAATSTLGEYEGQVSFTTEGRWLVKVNLSARGRSQEVEFTVDVVKRGPNWYVLGGFLSLNTVVVAVAAVMKHRTAEA
ncbi:MAG: hypothetical protein HS126_07425 [Anaerolineales bacterium]|nr:hypothetical protein [Anaerolineales bacterium]